MKIAALLLAILLPVSVPADSPDRDGNFVGKAAPGFEATDLSGTRIGSCQGVESGKPMLLNFWGLRCGQCIMEMPHLNALNERYGKRANMYGINVDGIDGGTLSSQIRKMKIDIRYTVVPDPELKLVDLFRMNGAPLTIIIDAGGIVRYRHEGYEPGDEARMEEALKSAIEGGMVFSK